VPDPKLVGNIEFILSYGKGGIQNEIKIMPLGPAKQLTDLVMFPKRCYLSDVQYIKLEEDIPTPFNFRCPLPLKSTPTEGLRSALEELSEVLESGFFEIEWKTARGKIKRYKPKKEKSEL
jgi:hypothetical protein